MNLKNMINGKKAHTKERLLCDSIPTNFKNRQNQPTVKEIRKVARAID